MRQTCALHRATGGSAVKGWITIAAQSLGRINVVGKSVAGSSEPVHLVVQSLQPPSLTRSAKSAPSWRVTAAD